MSATESAQQVVKQLSQGDFAAVEQRLASTIKPSLPAERLHNIWQEIEQQFGAFQKQEKASAILLQPNLVQVVTCTFERAMLDINVTLNSAGEISSLTVTPVGTIEQQANAVYDAPSYAQPTLFQEHEVQIGHGMWVLPGTLSIPKGAGPCAGVVLVHGSGPNDRDETIHPNKPFRDLAWGLASQGIAVLRYDKRTNVYAAKMTIEKDTLTVKEEVIDDALAAVAFLRTRPEIDAQHIFVLGHSLGGNQAPRIAAADSEIHGLIILAGSARPLEDVILDQMTYILSLSTPDTSAREQQLAALKKQVDLVKDPVRLPTAAASELPFNTPAAYWVDLNTYHPDKVAQTLKQPMFILQGESDYQVTHNDFQIWQDALQTHSNVQFKVYPALGHLFMPIEGGLKATPDSYTVASHVSEEVVNDIGSWVKQS